MELRRSIIRMVIVIPVVIITCFFHQYNAVYRSVILGVLLNIPFYIFECNMCRLYNTKTSRMNEELILCSITSVIRTIMILCLWHDQYPGLNSQLLMDGMIAVVISLIYYHMRTS